MVVTAVREREREISISSCRQGERWGESYAKKSIKQNNY